MALVKNGLPDGYTAEELFILDIPGRGACYVNCDGIAIDQLGKKQPTNEELDEVVGQLDETKTELADATAEIERLRALIAAQPVSGGKELKTPAL